MSLSPCTQRLYNIFKTASGKEPVSDADFTNLFWPRHELSLGEISLFFGHFANLVRPLLFSLNAVGAGTKCAMPRLARVSSSC